MGRRGRRAREVAAIGVAAVLAGASTYCGGPSFETLTAGDDGGSASADGSQAHDGTAPGDDDGGRRADGAFPDGALPDATLPDGAVPDAPDVDHDGQVPPDGALLDANAPFSCATAPASLFCCDFNTGAAPGSQWSQALSFGNGTNAFDPTTFRSPPQGYVASTPLTTTAAGASLGLQITKVVAPSVEYAFSFLVKQQDTTLGSSATIARLSIGSTRQLLLDFTLDSSGLHLVQSAPLSDGGQATQTDLLHAPYATNTWTRLRVTLDRAAGHDTVRVVLDETTTFQVGAIAHADAAEAEIDLGLIYVKPPTGGADTVTYDDVILRGL